MATRPRETVVRIWTHEVAIGSADDYEARLRDRELPALRSLPGHQGSELLRADTADIARFVAISHWNTADAGIGGIGGEFASSGHSTVHRVVGGRRVDLDLELGQRVAVEPAVPIRDGRRRDLVTVLALGVLAAVLVAWLGRRGTEATTPTDSPAPPATVRVDDTSAAEAFVPWPDPPADHDPHVIGRPGAGQPIRADLAGVTLVYVNDQLRPTVIDLSTGDQRELDVAETRVSDTFLVENGRVVVTDELDPDLPLSAGNAFVFRVVVDGAAPVEPGPVPTLCLTSEPGCGDRPWTSGRFGDGERSAESIDGIEPTAAIAATVGAARWTRDGRWITLELEGMTDGLRVPSPFDGAVVWAVVEPV